MHVTILGAGALGSVYGARLAQAGCEVAVVARQACAPRTLRLEKVDDGVAMTWSVPAGVTAPPDATDVILAFVRYEQLGSLPASANRTSAPIVVMTPMMPQDCERLSAALAGRVVPGMPSIAAYQDDAGTVRYWLPRVATTFIEERPEPRLGTLAACLVRAGIRTELSHSVLERNVATTVSFLPLALGLDVAGGIDALLSDRSLLALTLDAAREGRELGRKVGQPEAWASMLLRFVTPMTLRMGVRIARSRAPEAVSYVDRHFGRKLRAQNVAMARSIVALAEMKGVPAVHVAALRDRLAAP